MSKNTSISLGSHFDKFIQTTLNAGRYKNASEAIRAGLRLLEEEEKKLALLRKAIEAGVNSGIAEDFNPRKHLSKLKSGKK